MNFKKSSSKEEKVDIYVHNVVLVSVRSSSGVVDELQVS